MEVPVLRRPRQEERKFKVSWSCRGTLSEKTETKEDKEGRKRGWRVD